jgi:hypothetical protein
MALFFWNVNPFWGGQFRKCPLGVELGITVSQDVPVLLTVFTKVKTVTSHIDCMHQLSTVQMVHPATKKSYSPFYIPGENFPIGFRVIPYKYFALVSHLFDSYVSFDVSIMALFIWSVKSFWSGQFRKCPLSSLDLFQWVDWIKQGFNESHLFDSCFSFDVTTIAVFTMAVQALVDTLIIGTLDNIHPSFLCLVQVYQRVGFIG